MAGAELINVSKMIWSCLAYLTKRKTLPILSVLRMVEVMPKDAPMSKKLTMMRITMVRITTVKSKTFQLSLKY